MCVTAGVADGKEVGVAEVVAKGAAADPTTAGAEVGVATRWEAVVVMATADSFTPGTGGNTGSVGVGLECLLAEGELRGLERVRPRNGDPGMLSSTDRKSVV